MSNGNRGGQLGNNNASKGKPWEAAIKRALARYSNNNIAKGLDKLADQLVKAAGDKGDQWAIREIGDRMDGKPAQSIVGEDGGPLTIEIVRFASTNPVITDTDPLQVKIASTDPE